MPGSHPELIPWFYVAYVVLSMGVARLPVGRFRDVAFALANLGSACMIHFYLRDPRTWLVFCVYVAVVGGFYVLARWFAGSEGSRPFIAFAAPIAMLALVRWFPIQLLAGHSAALAKKLARDPEFSVAPYFVGLSYLAFRCSRMVIEVRNGAVAMPNIFRYLGFAFFVPVIAVGPIHTLGQHGRGLDGTADQPPLWRCFGRAAVGLAKFLFLAALVNQLAYAQLLLDGSKHTWPELIVAAISYYIFLYLNFSGACDLAIGLAGLAGIEVPENFDAPLTARNVRDFWNRWHITLSEYMRDMVFAPLSKRLVAVLGPSRAHHALALTIMVVFILIGVWHGIGWNYAAFGLVHAIGVVANHYYTLFLKRRLTREAWIAYNANPWIRRAATGATFMYVAASLFLFANTPKEMREILHVLR
jgi:D-alanyl-lipoteichoic acid acyltransferase DltB (MBOAT superfamily)